MRGERSPNEFLHHPLAHQFGRQSASLRLSSQGFSHRPQEFRLATAFPAQRRQIERNQRNQRSRIPRRFAEAASGSAA